jgi:hypothetical protein
MKRLLSLLIVLMLAAPIAAFDAISSGGIGVMMQYQAHSEMAYYVGISAPVVTKVESGYRLLNETGFIYSGFSDKIKGLRTYAVNCKNIVTKPKWSLYGGLAGGLWQFLVDNNQTGAETFGAVMARFGIKWGCLDIQLNGEVIQKQGPDLFFPSLGVNIDF